MNEELEYLSKELSRFEFEFESEVNRVIVFKRKVALDYFHEVIMWPNGMIEVKHYLYGRVYYGEASKCTLVGVMNQVLPDVVKDIIVDNVDDLPW